MPPRIGPFDIADPVVSFHRNGIAGQSFYRVDFVFIQDGPRGYSDFHALTAIVPDDGLSEECWPTGGIRCYVISRGPQSDHHQKWRGDEFADVMRQIIADRSTHLKDSGDPIQP